MNRLRYLSIWPGLAACMLLMCACQPGILTSGNSPTVEEVDEAPDDGFDYPEAADIAASRWIAMAEFYNRLTAQQAQAGELALQTYVDVPYTSNQVVDIVAPRNKGNWPIVVMLHGLGGDKSQYAAGAEAIARHGAVVFNTNWRTEPWKYGELALMEDTACAVRFARYRGPDYSEDESRLVLFGHSIGGWSGAVIALSQTEFEGDCLVTDVSQVPDAFVGYAGAYDAGGASYLQEENPDLWQRINPFGLIGGNPDLHFRLLAGDQDSENVVLAERFFSSLTDAGYDANLTVLQGVGHDGPEPGTAEFDTLIEAFLTGAGTG